jgi:taurine dioxygenase
MSTTESGVPARPGRDAVAGATSHAPLRIRALSPLMAAEVIGLDLRRALDEATRAAVYRAFLEHQVLVFRGQALDKAQQIAFTQQFGQLEEHRARNRGDDAFPLVHEVNNLGPDGKPSGALKSTAWHTDKSFRPAPALATILHAVTLPPDGGDTCFANMYAAYEALPDADKAALDGVRVVHSWPLSREQGGRAMPEEEIRANPPMSHALVRVHAETGRKCLYLGVHAAYLEDVPFEQGRARILALEAHATQPRFVYRHHWTPGDVLMWDNRCLLHRADSNFDAAQHPRVLHRTCLVGTPTAGQRIAREPLYG